MNIKPDRITHFEVAFRKSQKHGVKFNIIAPNTLEELDKARINLKSQLFIDFHIAISPNVPVVLFEINSPQEVGSPVWNINLNGSRLYHIPPKSYSYLDEFVNETEFLISQGYTNPDTGKRKNLYFYIQCAARYIS